MLEMSALLSLYDGTISWLATSTLFYAKFLKPYTVISPFECKQLAFLMGSIQLNETSM